MSEHFILPKGSIEVTSKKVTTGVTCTPNEREFLDEIIKHGVIDSEGHIRVKVCSFDENKFLDTVKEKLRKGLSFTYLGKWGLNETNQIVELDNG